MKIHRVLGPGFLESVYQNALLLELRKAGLTVDTQKRLQVRYEGSVVGDFVADIVVNAALILELSQSHRHRYRTPSKFWLFQPRGAAQGPLASC